jgi:Cu-processing system ATP-binding protein
VIEIRRLTKRFGDLTALRDVDVTIARGRVTAVVGPNAAGKTTLIKSVLGLVRPDSGEIFVDGQQLDGDERYRRRIGYMPQIARYPENLTGAALLSFLTELRGGVGHAPIDEELVDQLGLRRQLDRPLRVLSGGTRQKMNAVVAFLFRPDLLILDEPTAGLDPLSSSLLKDKILAERGVGRTVVVTSHVMSELETLADDVVFLLDGEVRFAGSLAMLKQLTRQATLERAVAHLMIREVAA